MQLSTHRVCVVISQYKETLPRYWQGPNGLTASSFMPRGLGVPNGGVRVHALKEVSLVHKEVFFIQSVPCK